VYGEAVEGNEPRDTIHEGKQDVVERVARHEQARDLVHHADAQCAPVQTPHVIDGGAQLARKARRQRRAREGTGAPEQRELAHRLSRLAERRAEQRGGAASEGHRRRPDRRRGLLHERAQRCVVGRRQPPPGGGHHDGGGTRRPEDEDAGAGSGQTHEPREGARQPLLDGARSAERREEIGKHAADLHCGVRTFPGRLPVCSPLLITKRPLTMTCSMPSG
jgi:hypothetical protein